MHARLTILRPNGAPQCRDPILRPNTGPQNERRPAYFGCLCRGQKFKAIALRADAARMAESNSLDTFSLVPTVRLGRILNDARTRQGTTLPALARAGGSRFSSEELAAVEAGQRRLSDEEIAHLARVYGVETAAVMPQRTRLVIDLHDRTITIGDKTAKASKRDSLTDGVLTRYLSLLYKLRGEQPGQPLRLRQLDLDVLGESLWLEPHLVEHRLVGLMPERVGELKKRSGLLGRRLVVPAVGILVAVTAGGTLVLEANPNSGDQMPSMIPQVPAHAGNELLMVGAMGASRGN